MQAIAAWLVAKPQNAVIALAVTILPTLMVMLSSIILVLLVLKKGVRATLVYAAVAGGIAAVVALIAGWPLTVITDGVVTVWMPSLVLAVVLTQTRSLTLTLQLSVVFTVIAVSVFLAVVGDAAEFWRVWTESQISELRELGRNDEAEQLASLLPLIVEGMTVGAAFVVWSWHSIACVAGYLLLRQLPGETARYGLFRNMNMGRVIAVTLAIASVAAALAGSSWLQNIAFVMFLVFWLQGLAVLHWLHAAGHLPVFGLVAVYVLLPVLNAILVMSLAVVGYIDAWFRLRRPRNETEQ